MKSLSTYALLIGILLLNGGAGCFNKNNDPQPILGYCKKIIVSEDGDETEYEFDSQGHLLKLFGKLVANFYKNPYNSALEWKLGDSNIKLARGNVAWTYEIKDGAKNGFENMLYPIDQGKGQKIHSMVSLGFEEGNIVNEIIEDYVYDANGNCTQIKNGQSGIDGKEVLKYSANFKFTDKITPFANSPFQWLIELNWSAGGHTNTHLTESEEYTIERVDDPDVQVNIKRNVAYSYKYDSQGRVSRIQMDNQEVTDVHVLDTGQKYQTKNTKQKIVMFIYDC